MTGVPIDIEVTPLRVEAQAPARHALMDAALAGAELLGRAGSGLRRLHDGLWAAGGAVGDVGHALLERTADFVDQRERGQR